MNSITIEWMTIVFTVGLWFLVEGVFWRGLMLVYDGDGGCLFDFIWFCCGMGMG